MKKAILKNITLKKKILTVTAAVLIIVMSTGSALAAGITNAGQPIELDELVSNNERLADNITRIYIDGSQIKAEITSTLTGDEMNFSVRKVGIKTSSVWIGRAYAQYAGEFKKYSFGFDPKAYGRLSDSLEDGEYVLLMTLKGEGREPYLYYKNCCFRVSGDTTKILHYEKIEAQNRKVTERADKTSIKKYLDTKLTDLKYFAMREPSKKKAGYFKTVAASVTAGAEDDYEKLLKIYEYLGENIYYDNYAFSRGKNQYTDPYRNLFNMRNNRKSENSAPDSSGQAKVATTCVGYGALVVALARAEGIPARVINGHHIALNAVYNNWSTEDDITNMDHWWAECYVDGRWIIVDPTPANGNRWDRKSFSDNGKWTYTGLTNYTYFDPTAEQFAQSHEAFERAGRY